jgi:hypothetical protein
MFGGNKMGGGCASMARMKTKIIALVQIAAFSFGMSNFGSVLMAQASKPPAAVKAAAPQAVMDAFTKAYPHSELKNVTSEKEAGKVEWELETVEGTVTRNVVYTAEGKLIAIEDGISAAQLPKVVADAVAKKYPKGTLSKIEQVKSAAGAISYEMVVTTTGKAATVEVDDKGKIQ